MIFTMEELESYTVRQLKNIAIYLGLEFPDSVSKGRLVEKIYKELEKRDPVSGEVEDMPPMSVRIQRIRNSAKEN